MRKTFLLLALFALFAPFACSGKIEDRLLGTWNETGGADNVLTFVGDHTLRQVTSGVTYTATWRVVDEQHVEIVFNGEASRLGTTTLTIVLDGNDLTTTNSAGRVQHWKRE